MSRLEWLLGGLLALLLVIIMGVLMIFWIRSAEPDPPETIIMAQYTARTAYHLAEPVAQQWQADAHLLSANASWPRSNQFAVTDANWGFTFHSPSQQTIVIISVIGDHVRLVNTQKINRSLALADLETWTIDSGDILAQFFAAGGQNFLDEQGESALLLTLNTNPTVTWTGQLMDREALRSFKIQFDAQTGEILTVQQAPP